MPALIDIVREKAVGMLFALLVALLLTAGTSLVTLGQIRVELDYMNERLDVAAADRYTAADARRDQNLIQSQMNDLNRRLARLEAIQDR